MMKYIQKLGKSMMLPVAVLPICGILMGIGYFLCPSAMSQNIETLNLISKIGYLLVKCGTAVIDNMPILFVIGVSLGMSDDNDGAVCMAGIVGWLIVINLLNPKVLSLVFKDIAENQTINLAFQKISNPFIAILVGMISVICYNKYKNVKLIDALSFFSGRRFVVISVVLYSLLLCIILFFIWPLFFSIFVICGDYILKLKGVGVGIYAFLNRLLIPSGLHHALNNVFWFDTIGIGDLTAYWAGKTSADVGFDVGMYMSGFFPNMMFGVPGATFAIITSSKNKKKATGIFLSSAICAFICGLTEPFEFAFMFTAFPLYIVYSLLYGVFSFITYLINFRAGFSFSGGVLDLIFSSTLPAAKNTLLIIPLGMVVFIVYYIVFKFMITKFKFNIVEDDVNNENINDGNTNMPMMIVEGLGGKNNITSIDCCATRLRVEINDISKINENKIKKAGALGYVKISEKACQVIVGLKVQQVLEEIKCIMNNNLNENKNVSNKIKHGENIECYFEKIDKKNQNIEKTCNEKCEFDYVVKLKNGMHARPAGKLVNIVKDYNSKVKIFANNKIADGNSIMNIMSLGIVNGTNVKIEIEGNDVDKVKKEIEKCLNEEE